MQWLLVMTVVSLSYLDDGSVPGDVLHSALVGTSQTADACDKDSEVIEEDMNKESDGFTQVIVGCLPVTDEMFETIYEAQEWTF